MASLLETFGILFESDADEVREGAEEAGKSTDDLEQKIQDTDVATEKLGDSFLDLVTSAKGAIAGVLSVGAISAALINSARQTDEIGKFSKALGLNIEEVNAWGEAVRRSGGSAESFRSSLGSLTDRITDFAISGGEGSGEVFARLGIQAFDAAGNIKSAFDILPELASAFERLTEAEAVGFGQRLGLDQGTILLLQQGRREVDALVRRQEQLGVATEKDAEIAAEFNDAWSDFSQKVSNQIRRMAGIVLPIFTRLLDSVDDFIEFLRNNRTIIEGFFIGIAGVITAIYLPTILATAAATIAAIAPFLLIAIVIAAIGAAFALIYEDIIAFQNGQDSLIGTILEKYPLVGKAIDFIRDAFNSLIDIGAHVFDILEKIFTGDFEGALQGILGLFSGNFKDAVIADFQEIVDFITGTFTGIQDFIFGILNAIAEKLSDVIPDLGDFAEGIKGFFGIGSDTSQVPGTLPSETAQAMERGNTSMQAAANNPLAAQTSNSINTTNNTTANRSTHVAVGTVAVDARGGDSREIASGVGSALGEQMRQAISDFDNGVAI